ncbi:998_t:CDS:2 [Scutellospora calospora]|uniref:998_t:CDS:1 n=1 Tax=Scutellospora calospora TaxID=85575 RepID=A0ACA9KI83_9GLOM|nr:998_t:CDS:2 [Scutellospora calospora]
MFTDVSVDTSVKVIEEWISFSDDVKIYTRTWKAVSDKPTATVLFIHGFGEYVKRYNHVFDKFGKKNIEVFAYDQRGFGRTAKQYNNHGDSGGWEIIKADITHALTSQRRNGIPQFLMGHSMGGGLTLRYACEIDEKHNNVAGFICASPWLQLSPQSDPISRKIGLFFLPTLSKFLPNNKTDASVDAKYISRDPVQIKKYQDDQMIIDSKYATYKTHPVTSPEASKQFVQKTKASNVMFREWKDRLHEMHNDYDNTEVIQSYIQWILEQVNSATEE